MQIKPATPEAYKLFHEGVQTLSQIEANGIRVDVDYLRGTTEQTKKDLRRLERELLDAEEFVVWKKRFGNKVKLKAHKQLGTVIFDSLGYKRKHVVKKQFTNEEGEQEEESDKNDQFAFDHIDLPFVRKWFEWIKLHNVLTRLNGISDELSGEFLHPFFNLHTVRTYRSSSDKVNFQNFHTRNARLAEILRRCFIARDGYIIGENDFKGIEVCVGACNHLDKLMIKYIKTGYDYHKEYAAKCYKMDADKVSKDARYCAKNRFVFPQFYGSYYVDCARHLWEAIDQMKLTMDDVPLKEHLKEQGIKGLGACDPAEKARKGTFEHHIQTVENELWELFHGYAEWKERFYKQYRKRGYFELLSGFVCWGLYSKNDVTNYPIQGAAFHCLLWVLTQLQKWLNKYKMKTKLVGQIHDSIIGDVYVRELDDYLSQIKYLVEEALPKHFPWIVVPMEIEAELAPEGKSWFHKRSVPI